MRDSVRQTIKHHQLLKSDSRVLVGVSGGADSMALLHILYTLRNEYQLDLHVIHVNHGLRGEESDEDEQFVKDFASGLGLPVHVRRPDVYRVVDEQGLSKQVAAREVRYDSFEEVAQSIEADTIALAHHADDQAETVLMRIIRGTSGSGVTGIPIQRKRKNWNIIRPLFHQWRSMIEEYCRLEGISYRNDSSNASITYFRNKIRLQLIPQLEEEYNPQIKKALVQLGEIMADEDRLLDDLAREQFPNIVLENESGLMTLDAGRLLSLPVALQRRVITLILYYLFGQPQNLWEAVHVEQIRELAAGDSPSAIIHLPGNIKARREYQFIHIGWQDDQPSSLDSPVKLQIPGTTKIPGWIFYADYRSVPVFKTESPWVSTFDADLLEEKSIYIRNRLQGDRIHPLGFTGTKKVKSLLIDSKIPRHARESWPLLVVDDEIGWVVGVRRGDIATVSDKTVRTLFVSCEPLIEQGVIDNRR